MAISGVGGVSGLAGAIQARGSSTQLSPEEQQEVNRLKAIDRKVRAHEQAHMAAGAGVTGGANYQLTRGPDGRQYAVGGEVTINLSAAQTRKPHRPGAPDSGRSAGAGGSLVAGSCRGRRRRDAGKPGTRGVEQDGAGGTGG